MDATRRRAATIIIFGLVAAIAAATSLAIFSFPVFHLTVGVITVAISLSIALTLFAANGLTHGGYFVVPAVAYGYLAVIELMQILAKPDLGMLRHAGVATVATIWVAGRLLEAVALLVAMLAVRRRMPARRTALVVGLYTAGAIAFTLVSPVVTNHVPVVLAAAALTAFIFAAAALAARHARSQHAGARMDEKLSRLIEWAAWMGALAQIAAGFAVIAPTGAVVASHVIRVVSIALVGVALVEQTVRRPLRTAYAQVTEAADAQSFVMDRANAWLVGVDDEDRLTIWNETAERRSGYTLGELGDLGTMCRVLIADDAEREWLATVHTELTQQTPRMTDVKTRVRTRSGHTRIISWNLDLVAEPRTERGGIIGVGIDVTELEQSRATLRTNESMHRLLLENLHEGLWALDGQGRTLYVNASAAQMVGVHAAELAGRSFDEFCPDIGDAVREQISTETSIRRPDGTVSHVNISGSPITGDAGETHGALLSIVDRSEYRRVNEANALLTQAVNQACESIYITDADGAIQFVNPAFTDVTGFPASEAIGRSPCELHGGPCEPECYEELWTRLADKRKWKGTLHNRRRDGAEYLEELSISPFFDESGEVAGYIAVGRDATQESRLKAHMETTQRLEAIGTLAGGIAHDFNNILMAILGYAQIASTTLPEDSPVRAMLDKISMAGNRAHRLADQILTFSRGTTDESEPTDVRTVVEEALGLLQASAPKSVTVEASLPADLPQVMVNPTQLVQVILNLGVNAIHATETKHSGRIAIRASHLESFDDGSTPAVRRANQVAVEVVDNGVGMDAEVVSRLFEPFYTTKPVGKGSGMGLPVVHGIVSAVGGAVEVRSRPDAGTKFTVYLPAIEQAAGVAPEDPASALEEGSEVTVSSGGINE